MKPIEQKFYKWNGYLLANSNIELGVTPEIGGRIISLKFNGEELLFVDPNHCGETFDFSSVSDLAAEKRKLGFRVWGGDKTWVAPETAWIESIPPLDLDAMPYSVELEENAVISFTEFGDFSLGILFVYYIKKEGDIMGAQTEVNLEVKKRFEELGIEMAFPTQTVYTIPESKP